MKDRAPPRRAVLVPWDPLEAAEVAYAARWAGVSTQCVRRWCERHALGRKIAGRWMVSRLAFAAFVEGDRATLARYHDGDRTSTEVLAYFAAMQFPRVLERLRQDLEQSNQSN